MIIKIGDIFESKSNTLVNTVNCVGVMGKGIAAVFKDKYPAMYKEYVQLCERHELKPGHPYLYTDSSGASIINFPTKDHWRSPSRLTYIIDGLDWFRENYKSLGITSIAFPPLGCGNGGLSWEVVGPVMYKKLYDLPIKTEIYAPYGTNPILLREENLLKSADNARKEEVGLKSTPFNKYWLLILFTIQTLNNDRYSLNVGRTIFQKICYVLTYTGIPMGFIFNEGSYGPYSVEAKQAVTALSNANLMTERQYGRMIETVVAPSFKLPFDQFTSEEMQKTNRAIDLLCRVKSTDHAEMITTVLFAYEELTKKQRDVSDVDVYNHVLQWKKRWNDTKESEVISTIENLSAIGWISPLATDQWGTDDYLY